MSAAGDDYIYTMHVLKDNGGLKASSFIAGAMAVGQTSRADHMMYYDAMPSAWNSMFDSLFLTPMKGYYPFKMYGQLYRMGDNISALTDDEKVYAVAAKGNAECGVMVTYFDDDDSSPAKDVALTLKNLPGDGMKKIEYYIVDKDSDMKLYRTDLTTAAEITSILPTELFTTWYVRAAAE